MESCTVLLFSRFRLWLLWGLVWICVSNGGLQRSATVFGNNNSSSSAAQHNDIIGGRAAWSGGQGARRMRGFDGQGRGRAILPRAAATAGPSHAPSSGNIFHQGLMRSSRREWPPTPTHTSNKVNSNLKGAIERINNLIHILICCVMFVIKLPMLYVYLRTC